MSKHLHDNYERYYLEFSEIPLHHLRALLKLGIMPTRISRMVQVAQLITFQAIATARRESFTGDSPNE